MPFEVLKLGNVEILIEVEEGVEIPEGTPGGMFFGGKDDVGSIYLRFGEDTLVPILRLGNVSWQFEKGIVLDFVKAAQEGS